MVPTVGEPVTETMANSRQIKPLSMSVYYNILRKTIEDIKIILTI